MWNCARAGFARVIEPGGVIQPAEEQRRVGQVDQGLGAAVQIGLEVFLGDPIRAESAERQHVLAHEPQEVPRPVQMLPFGDQDRVVPARIRRRAHEGMDHHLRDEKGPCPPHRAGGRTVGPAEPRGGPAAAAGGG